MEAVAGVVGVDLEVALPQQGTGVDPEGELVSRTRRSDGVTFGDGHEPRRGAAMPGQQRGVEVDRQEPSHDLEQRRFEELGVVHGQQEVARSIAQRADDVSPRSRRRVRPPRHRGSLRGSASDGCQEWCGPRGGAIDEDLGRVPQLQHQLEHLDGCLAVAGEDRSPGKRHSARQRLRGRASERIARPAPHGSLATMLQTKRRSRGTVERGTGGCQKGPARPLVPGSLGRTNRAHVS